MRKLIPEFKFRYRLSSVLACVVLASTGCAVRRTTHVALPKSVVAAKAMDASAEDLIGRVNALGGKIQTLTATVDFEPTAGSVYSGVIKEYHDVNGFILLKRPQMIRLIGQAPVIRTNIFDMVSDGTKFWLSLPPKHKFIVGQTAMTRLAKNSLENLRPQHILSALLPQPIRDASEKISLEEAQEAGHKYYVLTVFRPGQNGPMFPQRKFWIDRSDLDVARFESYGPQGEYLEDVRYSGYEDFQGTRYPSRIEISRPAEDYQLAINLQKAVFNQEIPPGNFVLKQLPGEELVEMSAADKPGLMPEATHGK